CSTWKSVLRPLYRSVYLCNLFFFSSRRRHTRWPRDWSSDVCSSDLLQKKHGLGCPSRSQTWRFFRREISQMGRFSNRHAHGLREIGRASCRERVESSGGAGGVERIKEGDRVE